MRDVHEAKEILEARLRSPGRTPHHLGGDRIAGEQPNLRELPYPVCATMHSQHHVDGLDLTLCPLEYLLREFPGTAEEKMRSHLSSFGIPQDLQLRAMYKMSGGQKSRVAFAKITFDRPHVLLLDEPSNHLDMDAVDALIVGLNLFQGCVILVSHDEHLIGASADELWVCADRKVTKYPESFEHYKKSLSKQ